MKFHLKSGLPSDLSMKFHRDGEKNHGKKKKKKKREKEKEKEKKKKKKREKKKKTKKKRRRRRGKKNNNLFSFELGFHINNLVELRF
jgi:hypothetical protein